MNDMDSTPVFLSTPTVQLTPSVLAYSSDEGCVMDFLPKTQRTWRIEIFGTMNREAISYSTEEMAEKRDVGRVASEMSVQMLGAARH